MIHPFWGVALLLWPVTGALLAWVGSRVVQGAVGPRTAFLRASFAVALMWAGAYATLWREGIYPLAAWAIPVLAPLTTGAWLAYAVRSGDDFWLPDWRFSNLVVAALGYFPQLMLLWWETDLEGL